MSYSCLRHKWTSPIQPCNSCSIEQQGGYNQRMNVRNEEMMRANMQAQRWPQDVFERYEAEMAVAVKLAATYRVALEKIIEQPSWAEDLAREALGMKEPDPSGSEGSDG